MKNVRLIVAGMVAALGSTAYATAFAASPVSHATAEASTSSSPTHVAPAKVAWYDVSRAAPAAPAAPMPGVGPKDLLVEGLTINTALLPVSLPIPPIKQVTAFTALSFTLPKDATAATLTLRLKGLTTATIAAKLPSGVTPVACPITSPFKAGQQQAISAAPKYDCSKRSTVGQMGAGGKTVTFPGISRLQTGDTLSVVILPGSLGLERLVFSPPDAKTLSLLSFGAPLPTTTPSVPPPPTPTTGSPAATAPSGDDVPPVALPPAQSLPTAVPSQPVIASTSPGAALAPAALSQPDDTRDRTAAIGMLLLLLAAVAWLVVTERAGRAAAPASELGIGRFRSARNGPPPTI